MHLANNEYSFSCRVKGDKTDMTFEGDFTVKCVLNNEEILDIALRSDRYCGGSRTLGPSFQLMNRTIAELEVRIVRNKEGKALAPSWFVESDFGRLLYDTNVLYHIFNEAMKAEDIWKERLAEKAKKAEEQADKTPAKPKESQA